MKKQKKKRGPLFYIHQPSLQTPKGKMQDSFSLKQAAKRKQKENDKSNEGVHKKQNEESALTTAEVQKSIEEYENNTHKHGGGLKRLKPFKEMNIEEKLNYLHHFPKQLPPVPCLFQTEDKGVRGVLMDKNDEEVILKLLNKTEATIKLRELVDIRMIGF